MAIHTIPQIKVGGYKYPVYSFDYNAGLNAGPSTIEIKFISEDGNYQTPVLSALSTTTITIDGFRTFNMHPIKYTLEESSSGKVMSITYADTSLVLDRIQVGLYKKFGTRNAPNLIIVGSEVDPCKSSFTDTLTRNTAADPCNPCKNKNGSRTSRNIDCLEERTLSILDVRYTFGQLLSAMRGVVAYLNAPIDNSNYYARYTGSLREVLNSWCQDFGYTFYWENNALIFVNLRSGIRINDSGINANSIISKTTSQSLEGTSSLGTLAYFGAAGEIKPYDCNSNQGKKITLYPIKLDDIIPPNSAIMDHYESFDRLEAMCAMSRYSQDLRDNYVWFIKEAINTPQIAESKIGQNIALLGNLQIKRVFHKASESSSDLTIYGQLKSLFTTKQQEEFEKKGGYFFVAKRDERVASKYYDFEAGMAEDFLGKYWIRKYGGVHRNSDMQILSPEGANVKHYVRHSSVPQFPFTKVLPDSLSKANQYLNDLVDPESGEAEDNFLLMDKNVVWSPSSAASEELSKLVADMSGVVFKSMGTSNLGNILTSDDESFYVAYTKPSRFTVSAFTSATNPDEANAVNVRADALGYISHYGLRSARTRKCRIASESIPRGIEIYLPAQSSVGQGGGSGGFSVIVATSGLAKTNVVVPKQELTQYAAPRGNVMRYEINYRDVTEYITGMLQSVVPGVCAYNTQMIVAAMKLFVNFTVMIQAPYERRTYEICGLPTTAFTLSNGLESFTIGFGDNGVQTSLAFSNLQKVLPSENYRDHANELLRQRLAAKTLSKLEEARSETLQTLN